MNDGTPFYNLFGTIAAILLVFLVLTGVFICNKEKVQSFVSATQAPGPIQTASDGAKYIKAIHADIATLKAIIGQRDSVIESLMTKHTGQIIRLEQQIRVLKATRVDSVIYVRSESGELMPEYHSAFKDRHLDYKIAAGPDTCKLDLTVFSSPVISTEWKRTGLFGPKEPTVYVRDDNPYISTIGITPVVVKGKKRNTGLKVAAAFLAGGIAVTLLK